MNKNAQIFTVIGILLIGLMFISFEIFSFVNKDDAVKTRVSTMESFLESVEENLERQVFISGFRIIFLAENEITSTGNYIFDTDTLFNEGFFQGKINGIIQNDSGQILNGATYSDLVDSLNRWADKINVNIFVNNPSINVTQTDPWNVNFTLTMNFSMQDKEGLALWNKKQTISSLIPIEGFEDPTFIVNSLARISRKINQTIHEGNYAPGGDVTNLLDHVNKGYYAENIDAPSFLKRLEGDLTADVNGIESFVNTPEFSVQGLPVDSTKSVIDHVYFDTQGSFGSTVPGMPSWFKIDNSHRSKYGV